MNYPPRNRTFRWTISLTDVALVIIAIFIVLAFFKGWG